MISALFEAEFIAEVKSHLAEGSSGRDNGSVKRKALAKERDLPVYLPCPKGQERVLRQCPAGQGFP